MVIDTETITLRIRYSELFADIIEDAEFEEVRDDTHDETNE